MSIEEVTRAIKNLCNNNDDDDEEEEEASSLDKVIEISDDSVNSDVSEDSEVKRRRLESDNFDYNSRFFCYEDTFCAKDINVEVEGIGELAFPISEASIQDMIKISSKAKFGKGEETLIDISVRDTQIIPACKLKVTLNEQTLSEVLERISSGLNIGKDCIIKPHLYNMLIYGPGQFFKKHQDSEKMPHMIATLVIVLPSIHKGGDLIIEHNNYKHAFFGSQNPEFIKCVAFYSDCHHEIKKVIEGYRVALTYNIVMESSVIPSAVAINNKLDNAVANYFDGDKSQKRLIYLLNHSYSKNSLKWSALKGTDRTHAHALFAVAKKQGRMPYLALADCQESRYDDDWYDDEEDSSTDLYFWVDEKNLNPDKSNFQICDTAGYISDSEICYTARTAELFEPYKTEENNGYTGNAAAPNDYWYKRACVVLFSSKWVFKEGFRFVVNEFYQLTFQKGNEDRLLEEINKVGDDFKKYAFWKDPSIAEMLFKIVVYLNNKESAILILSRLPEKLLVVDKIGLFLQLETQYDFETWNTIINKWTKKNQSWQKTLDNAIPFIEAYKKIVENTLDNANGCIEVYKNYEKKKSILKFLTNSNWSTLKGYRLALNELYQLTAKTGNVEILMKEINQAGEQFLNYVHWSDPLITDMLIRIVIYLNNPEKATLILSQLLTQLLNMSKIEALSELNNQYDVNVWAAVMEKRKILRISDKRFSAEDAKTDIKTVIKFIKKFKSFAPNSVLIHYLVTEIVNKYIGKISMGNQSKRCKIDGSRMMEFCLLLKTCIKTGHVIGKKALIDHAKTSYQTLTQADILFKLQEDLDPVDFVEFSDFKDHLIKRLDSEIEKIGPNSWKISVDIMCSCEHCNMVNIFLKSNTRTKIVVPAPDKIRRHISSNLYNLGSYIKTDTERKGSPFKLIIEKQGRVLLDRQNLIDALNVCKAKLLNLIFSEQLVSVETEKEHLLNSKILSKEEGELLADTSIKTEDFALYVKTEPVDTVEPQTNAETLKTTTQVEKENQVTTQLQTHIKVEGTSSENQVTTQLQTRIEVEGTSPENQLATQLQTRIKVEGTSPENQLVTELQTHIKLEGTSSENQITTQLQTHIKVEGTSPVRIKNETKSSIELFANCKIEPQDDLNDCDNGDNILPSKRQKMSDE